MPHYVYKYVLNDEIIYIGKTGHLKDRLAQHGTTGDNVDEHGRDDMKNSRRTLVTSVMS